MDNTIIESSEDKQERLNCYIGRPVDDWNCYSDCAHWDGKKRTRYEEEE